MANGSLLAGLATAVALTTGNVQAEKAPDFSALIDAGGAKVALVQEKTRNANNALVAETQPILLAQANLEDGRTGPYLTVIPQINGGTKVIEYFKNKKGLIIPPPIENGKLVDGNTAPSDPLEAKAEQRSVIAKYDKNAQINLALVSKEDIFGKAEKSLNDILAVTEKGGTINKEQLINGFYNAYIVSMSLGNGRGEKIISGLESIAKIKMKMNESEIAQIKRDAEMKAKNIWRSVTGTLA